MRGGDPAVCAHRVEHFTAFLRPGECAAEIQQFALIGLRQFTALKGLASVRWRSNNLLSSGLSTSLRSKACRVRGGDPEVCSHRVELLTAF